MNLQRLSTPVKARLLALAAMRAGTLRVMGDAPGHEFHGNQYASSKGTDKAHNEALVKASGVRIEAPAHLTDVMNEAVAHLVENKQLAASMRGRTVYLKDSGGRLHGHSGGQRLMLDQKSVEEHGPGFAAAIIRHELEHSLLSEKGVPTGQQESRVRYTAGMWAAMKYGSMAKTNPIAAKGFLHAAKVQGIKMRGAEEAGHEFHGNQWTSGGGGKDKSETFYHGTALPNLASIQSQGLKAAKSGQNFSTASGGSEAGHVYVTRSMLEAKQWAQQVASMDLQARSKGDPAGLAILHVVIPHSEAKNLVEDKHFPKGDARAFKGDIKPEWIKSVQVATFQRPAEWRTLAAAPDGEVFYIPIIVAVQPRSASRHPESAIHVAADAHLNAMTLAVSYGFLKGRKALKATLRSAGDVEGHEFHGNQYTVSGSITDKTGKSYEVQVRQRLYPGNDVPKQEYRVINEHGHTVASAELRREKKAVSSVYVQEQRKGIATALYKHIEEHLGYKLEPNAALTDEGKAFWKSRHAASVPNVDAAVKAIRAALLVSLPPALLKAVVAGGQVGIGMLPKRLKAAELRALAPIDIRFDATSEEAIAWAEEHAGELAKNLSDTSEQAIKDAVAAALEGDGIDAAYDDILDAVGDEARAEMIARTEVMDAANEGLAMSWDQAQEAGLLPDSTMKVWVATSEACDDCDGVDGEEVPLDDEFSVGDDPPLHPNCRCTMGLSFGSAD